MCALFLTNAIWWRKCPPRWDVPKIVGGEERPSFLSECCWWPLLRDHLNSLHILSQDAVFIERSSIQEAALFVLFYNKSVQDLTPKHKIICSSLQISLRRKLSPRFICIPVMLLLDKHQCTSDLLYLHFVFVFVCLPNTRATTRTTWQCKCAPCTAAEELVATSSLFLDRLNLNLKCNHHPSTTL